MPATRATILTGLVVPVLGLALALAGCAEEGGSAGGGAKEGELRILSLAPNVTEILFAMGLGDRVVGRSSYCTYPPEVLDVPAVGDALALDVERVVALRPTMAFLVTGRSERLARLESLGVRPVAVESDTMPELFCSIRTIGETTGHPEAAADLLTKIAADLEAVRRLVRDRPRPRVLFTFPMTVGAVQVMVAGRGTFVDELLEVAGAQNAYPERADWPTVSPQRIVELAPEVLLVHAADADPAGDRVRALRRAWDRWRSIPAVASGRVHILTEGFITIPGPRVGEAAMRVARMVHPKPAGREAGVPHALCAAGLRPAAPGMQTRPRWVGYPPRHDVPPPMATRGEGTARAR